MQVLQRINGLFYLLFSKDLDLFLDSAFKGLERIVVYRIVGFCRIGLVLMDSAFKGLERFFDYRIVGFCRIGSVFLDSVSEDRISIFQELDAVGFSEDIGIAIDNTKMQQIQRR